MDPGDVLMKPKTIKRAVALTVVAGLATAATLYGVHWHTEGRYMQSTDDAYVQADVIDIRPEVQGRITRVLAHNNQVVHAGQALVEIDRTELHARVEQARAQLAVAQAAAAQMKEQIAMHARNIDEARANVSAAKAEARRTKLDLERNHALVRQAYASKQSLDGSRASAEVATARLEQARAALAAERQRITVLNAQFDSATASVAAARANLDYATSRLAKTRIVAPRSGVIGDLGAHVGDMAQPSLTLLRVVPIPNVYVTANYKETQIDHISIGQPVRIHVDAFPDIDFRGVVASLAPATGTEFSLLPQDNATGNFNKIVQRVPVRIRVTAPRDALNRLRPGLSVVTDVDTRHFDTQLNYLHAAPDRAQ
jgi:membrane fusion protein, multidrug efflux system